MNTYRVTLARLAWIFGSLKIEAESFEQAFDKAKADPEAAEWPLDEDGEPCMGFSPAEVSRAYCEDNEADHDGEPASAPSEVYLAAPALAAALQSIRTDLKAVGLWHYYSEKQGQGLSGACDEIDAALRAAGLEVTP